MTRPVRSDDWREARRQKKKELSQRRQYTRAINDTIARCERRAIDLGGAEFLPAAALDALTLAEEVLRLRSELDRKVMLHNEAIRSLPEWRRSDWSGNPW